MMISQKVADRLNLQIKYEFYSYWLYLQMAFKLETMGLKTFAQWFTEQAAEEQTHGMKIAKYLLDQDAEVKLLDLEEPPNDWPSVEAIVQNAVDHEIQVTQNINECVDFAIEAKDHATNNFLKWFVDEQVEEVATAKELLGLVKMAGTPDQLLILENRIMDLRAPGGGEQA
jgi:ferritin